MPGATAAAARPPGRRAVLGGLAVAVLVCAAWLALHPPRPLEATADLYTHLMVARHLARGDGFVTDIAYPLSFAWPFARELPQPLLHRAPGYALLLAGPVAAAGGDPGRALAAARLLQVGLLGGLIWLGAAAWLARGRPGAAVGWALLLAAHPLTGYAVDWGHDELAAALVLLAWWLRHRGGARVPAVTDGLLLGALALLRPELLWLPVLWWLLRRPTRPRGRALASCALAFLLVAGPWAVRNARLAGDPFFSLQAHAEHLKDTRGFPEYAVYRQLEPQPLLPTLLRDPEPVVRKTWRGLRFFRQEAGSFLPVPVAVAFLVCGLLLAARRLARGLPRRRGRPDSGPGFGPVDDLGGVGLGLVLVAGLYAVFDHSVRHLEVLLPLAAWELGPYLAERPWALVAGRFGRTSGGPPWLTGALAGAAALLVALAWVRPPAGWDQAQAAATHTAPLVQREVERLRAAPPGVVFVQTAAAPWIAGRAAVWDPLDEAVRARIVALAAGNGP